MNTRIISYNTPVILPEFVALFRNDVTPAGFIGIMEEALATGGYYLTFENGRIKYTSGLESRICECPDNLTFWHELCKRWPKTRTVNVPYGYNSTYFHEAGWVIQEAMMEAGGFLQAFGSKRNEWNKTYKQEMCRAKQ